jgi:hypothetical protein
VPSRRSLAGLIWLAGAISALPFWLPGFLPLVDLPQHLAAVSVLRYAGDPAWGFDRFYEVQWWEFTPYWTVYLLLDALSLVMPVETAARVFLTAYALGLPWAAFALLAAFDRPRWGALLVAPLTLNANLYFGFLSYLAGVVGCLGLLALVARQLDDPRPPRAAAIGLLACALFFTHVQALGFLLLSAPVLVLLRPRRSRWRSAVSTLLALGPAALVSGAWVYVQAIGPRSSEPGLYNFGTLDRLGATRRSVATAVADLPSDIAGSFQDGTDTILLGAWAVGLTALVVATRSRARAGPTAWWYEHRLESLAVLALLADLLLPVAIRGQWNVAPRFAWLFALLCVGALREGGPRLVQGATAGALALAGLTSLNAVLHHRWFQREARELEPVLAALPPATRVLGLVFDNRGDVMERWVYLHVPQYAMVRRGGAAAWSLAKSPPFPVREREPGRLPAPDPFRPQEVSIPDHLEPYDHVLTRAVPPGLRDGLAARTTHVLTAGEWDLWRNPGAR